MLLVASYLFAIAFSSHVDSLVLNVMDDVSGYTTQLFDRREYILLTELSLKKLGVHVTDEIHISITLLETTALSGQYPFWIVRSWSRIALTLLSVGEDAKTFDIVKLDSDTTRVLVRGPLILRLQGYPHFTLMIGEVRGVSAPLPEIVPFDQMDEPLGDTPYYTPRSSFSESCFKDEGDKHRDPDRSLSFFRKTARMLLWRARQPYKQNWLNRSFAFHPSWVTDPQSPRPEYHRKKVDGFNVEEIEELAEAMVELIDFAWDLMDCQIDCLILSIYNLEIFIMQETSNYDNAFDIFGVAQSQPAKPFESKVEEAQAIPPEQQQPKTVEVSPRAGSKPDVFTDTTIDHNEVVFEDLMSAPPKTESPLLRFRPIGDEGYRRNRIYDDKIFSMSIGDVAASWPVLLKLGPDRVGYNLMSVSHGTILRLLQTAIVATAAAVSDCMLDKVIISRFFYSNTRNVQRREYLFLESLNWSIQPPKNFPLLKSKIIQKILTFDE